MTTIAIYKENAEFLKTLKRNLSVIVDDDVNVNDVVAIMCATCDIAKMVEVWKNSRGREENISTVLFKEQNKIAETIKLVKITEE